jgi:hypothetical protein
VLLCEPRLAADQGVGQLVHEHRHAGVRRQAVGDLDAPPAVVAEPVEVFELAVGDPVAEVECERLERCEQRGVRVALHRGARRRQRRRLDSGQRFGLGDVLSRVSSEHGSTVVLR